MAHLPRRAGAGGLKSSSDDDDDDYDDDDDDNDEKEDYEKKKGQQQMARETTKRGRRRKIKRVKKSGPPETTDRLKERDKRVDTEIDDTEAAGEEREENGGTEEEEDTESLEKEDENTESLKKEEEDTGDLEEEKEEEGEEDEEEEEEEDTENLKKEDGKVEEEEDTENLKKEDVKEEEEEEEDTENVEKHEREETGDMEEEEDKEEEENTESFKKHEREETENIAGEEEAEEVDREDTDDEEEVKETEFLENEEEDTESSQNEEEEDTVDFEEEDEEENIESFKKHEREETENIAGEEEAEEVDREDTDDEEEVKETECLENEEEDTESSQNEEEEDTVDFEEEDEEEENTESFKKHEREETENIAGEEEAEDREDTDDEEEVKETECLENEEEDTESSQNEEEEEDPVDLEEEDKEEEGIEEDEEENTESFKKHEREETENIAGEEEAEEVDREDTDDEEEVKETECLENEEEDTESSQNEEEEDTVDLEEEYEEEEQEEEDTEKFEKHEREETENILQKEEAGEEDTEDEENEASDGVKEDREDPGSLEEEEDDLKLNNVNKDDVCTYTIEEEDDDDDNDETDEPDDEKYRYHKQQFNCQPSKIKKEEDEDDGDDSDDDEDASDEDQREKQENYEPEKRRNDEDADSEGEGREEEREEEEERIEYHENYDDNDNDDSANELEEEREELGEEEANNEKVEEEDKTEGYRTATGMEDIDKGTEEDDEDEEEEDENYGEEAEEDKSDYEAGTEDDNDLETIEEEKNYDEEAVKDKKVDKQKRIEDEETDEEETNGSSCSNDDEDESEDENETAVEKKGHEENNGDEAEASASFFRSSNSARGSRCGRGRCVRQSSNRGPFGGQHGASVCSTPHQIPSSARSTFRGRRGSVCTFLSRASSSVRRGHEDSSHASSNVRRGHEDSSRASSSVRRGHKDSSRASSSVRCGHEDSSRASSNVTRGYEDSPRTSSSVQSTPRERGDPVNSPSPVDSNSVRGGASVGSGDSANTSLHSTAVIKKILPMELWEAKIVQNCLNMNEAHAVFDKKAKGMVIIAPESQLQMCETLIFQHLAAIKKENLDIPKELLELVKDNSKLFKHLKASCVKGTHMLISDDDLYVAAMEQETAKVSADKLKDILVFGEDKVISQAEIPVRELEVLKKTVQKEGFVKVSWNESGTEVRFVGIKNDVLASVKRAESLTGNFIICEQTFQACESKAKFLHKFLETTVNGYPSIYNVEFVERISSDSEFKLVYKGTKAMVNRLGQELDRLVKDIHCKTWHLRDEFIQDSLSITKNIDSSTFQERVRVFETDHKCIVIFKATESEAPESPCSPSPKNMASPQSVSSYLSGQREVFSRELVNTGLVSVHFSITVICQLVLKAMNDITKETSDILVNVCRPSLELNKSSIGCAFLEACPDLQQKLKDERLRHKDDQVLVTSGPFTNSYLTCKSICHVILSPWKKNSSPNVLVQAVRLVLEHAAAIGAKSISLTPIGYGKALRFPASVVSRAVVEAMKTGPISEHLKQIIILATEKEIFWRMKIDCQKNFHLLGMTNGINITDDSDGSGDEEDDTETDNSEKVKTDMVEITGDDEEEETETDDPEKAETDMVEITRDDEEDTESLPLYTLQAPKTTEICIFSTNPQQFDNLWSKLKNEITEHCFYKNRLVSDRSPQRGTVEFLKHAAECAELYPSYWSLNKAASETSPSGAVLVDIDPKTKEAVCELMENTLWMQNVGMGYDASNLQYTQIVVTDVKRLENEKTFYTYSHYRKLLFQQMAKENRLCTDIGELEFSRGDLLTTRSLPEHMKTELYTEINEHYLFHGTKKENVIVLANNGFDPKLSNERGMLGKAVYAAETFMKADQYADDKDARSPNGSLLYVFLTRVLLGNVFLKRKDPNEKMEDKKLLRPPCKYCSLDSCRCDNQKLTDSTMVDGKKCLFREFGVYDLGRCYPEYLITYKRL